jgi:hypothetical protein
MYSTNQRTIFLAGQLDHGGVRGRRRMVYQGAIMEYIRYQYQYIIFNIIIDIRYHKVAINHFFFGCLFCRSTETWTFVASQPVLQWSASLFKMITQRSSLPLFQVLIVVHIVRDEVFAKWGALLGRCYRVHPYIDWFDCQVAVTMLEYLCDCHYCDSTPNIQDHHDLWERVWVPWMIEATKTKAHAEVESIDDPFMKGKL